MLGKMAHSLLLDMNKKVKRLCSYPLDCEQYNQRGRKMLVFDNKVKAAESIIPETAQLTLEFSYVRLYFLMVQSVLNWIFY